MKLILQIDLSDWKTRPYNKPLLDLARSIAADSVVADIDQDSEGFHIKGIMQLIEQAEKVMLVINAQPEMKLGATLEVFYAMIKSQKKIMHILLSGTNLYVEKLLVVFKDKVSLNCDEVEVEKIIKKFCYE